MDGVISELVLAFLLTGLRGIWVGNRTRWGVLRDVYFFTFDGTVGLFVFRQDEGYFCSTVLICSLLFYLVQ
jgi:hypothetical protein